MVETGGSSLGTPKSQKYEACYAELEAIFSANRGLTEMQKQKTLCEVLSKAFKPNGWNFVGFYDHRPEEEPRKVLIGEFVSELVFPCGEIDWGKG
jgi:putative methionine-R-sulfoxide reductase with GAF domain